MSENHPYATDNRLMNELSLKISDYISKRLEKHDIQNKVTVRLNIDASIDNYTIKKHEKLNEILEELINKI